MKANQEEINKKLDLVFELDKIVKMILEIFSKKTKKHDIQSNAI